MSEHRKFMAEAINEAEKGRGSVSPNPLVGAILVQNGQIISRGYHAEFGKDHAEVRALKNVNFQIKADLYITLEPCAHQGKTGPCLDLILKYKNIQNIFIGHVDPNPKVSGKSIRKLRSRGYKVKTHLLSDEIRKQNESYFHFTKTSRPFVTLKAATTLDGKIATSNGDSKWITSAFSRKKAHLLRAENDAVMVGIDTVLTDDPLLTSRNIEKKFNQPYRVIVDPSLRVDSNSRIIKTAFLHPTIFVCAKSAKAKNKNELKNAGIELITLPSNNRQISMKRLMVELGKRGIASVLLEGGSKLNASMLDAKVVNKLVQFVAPKILKDEALSVVSGKSVKSIKNAINLRIENVRRIGPDIMIESYVL